jgi:histidinol-phosphate/aromatic aminotransferase/cobyric acid decarboxylase-like protein
MTGELVPAGRGEPRRYVTAAEKVLNTLRELSRAAPGAGPMELTIATMCMGMERELEAQLLESKDTPQVDDFVLALTSFLATHRSDHARRLVVVEMPRAPQGMRLPNGKRLQLLDEAEARADAAVSPL